MTKTAEQRALLDQVLQIARGLGETFAPFCEIVVHDLLDPRHAVLAIHNNLSGRAPGDPATDLGLARIADPDHPQVVAGYANQFADGRPAKSTSIGLKDASGRYVAALCLNVDLTLFRSLQSALGQFVQVDKNTAIRESLDPSGADAIRQRIDQFAAHRATTPRALKTADRRVLLRELKASGAMDVRRAMDITAQYLGVSRGTVYSDAK
ncbi:MAG: helix-turn-helix transcriptional regulator [Janthinobacterium lividum]